MKKKIFIVLLGILLVISCSKDSQDNLTTDPTIPIPEGKIVFKGDDGNFYTINLDGSNEKQITLDGISGLKGFYWQPTWAPDGTNILYIQNLSGYKLEFRI